MKKALFLIFFPLYGMMSEDIVPIDNEEDYYCDLAIKSYNKVTSGSCSPSIKPYISRLVSYSRHNGESQRFAEMKREIKAEDEAFMTKIVDRAINVAIKDKEAELERRILKKDAAIYVAVGSLICSIITTGITLAATLSGKCP